MAVDKKDFYNDLEQSGEDYVRESLRLGRYQGRKAQLAQLWLEGREKTRLANDIETSKEANRDQIDIARSAKNAAWVAAIAAIMAVIAAIISLYLNFST